MRIYPIVRIIDIRVDPPTISVSAASARRTNHISYLQPPLVPCLVVAGGERPSLCRNAVRLALGDVLLYLCLNYLQ